MVTTELYHGDCLEFMQGMANKGKKVDCIITDPPYLYLKHKLDRKFNEELFFELAGKITWNKKQTTSPFHKLARAHETISVRMKKGNSINKVKIDALRKHFNEDNFECLLNDLKRVFSSVKNSDTIKNYLEKGIRILELHKSKHLLTTNKNLKSLDRNIRIIDKYKEGTIPSSIITEKREHYTMQHPTQKPYKLIEKLIQLVSNKNETILDPFMGSGSTGIACLTQERNFIGLKIKRKH